MVILDFDSVLNEVAERVAAKLVARLPQSDVGPRLLSVAQAALYLGRTKQAIQHMIAERRLPVVREGRRVHLDREALDRWIEGNTEPQDLGT